MTTIITVRLAINHSAIPASTAPRPKLHITILVSPPRRYLLPVRTTIVIVVSSSVLPFILRGIIPSPICSILSVMRRTTSISMTPIKAIHVGSAMLRVFWGC